MFIISMPANFQIGDTHPCRINRTPAKVTYRDAEHLVIEPGDVRAVLFVDIAGDGLKTTFICADAGEGPDNYAVIEPS